MIRTFDPSFCLQKIEGRMIRSQRALAGACTEKALQLWLASPLSPTIQGILSLFQFGEGFCHLLEHYFFVIKVDCATQNNTLIYSCLLPEIWADTLHLMDAALVEGKITSLDTFATWQAASSEQQRAFNAVPFEINAGDPDQLRQQLGYLATQDEQLAARQALMQELASQDDSFLPVGYRLGALAALEATNKAPTTKYLGGGRSVSRGSDMFRIDRHEQQIRPSSDPVKLAVQVGDEIERISSLLDTRRSVPVVMAWNHYFNPPRIDYDEVVMGELPNPREAFVLEAPKVSEVDGQKVVDYTIPSRLHGVVKGRIVRKDEYVQPEDKYKNPVITTLARLGVAKSSFMSHDPDALYIGKDEVKERVAKAERDNASYARQLERLRRIPSHLRRY